MSTKPRVLLLADVRGWAFDLNARDICTHLSDQFDFEVAYTENWFGGTDELPTPEQMDEYDVVYHMDPRRDLSQILPMERTIGSMRSQYLDMSFREPPADPEFQIANQYALWHVLTRRAFQEYRGGCPHVVYLTSPVDVQRFNSPTEVSGRVVAEWNGRADHKTVENEDIKGLDSILVPACQNAGVELRLAEFSHGRRDPEEMPTFYREANVALCASLVEGASGSVMEAMASGLAVIATDCGNHRELHDSMMAEYGDSGILLVDRSVEAFTGPLETFQADPGALWRMGRINYLEIRRAWSWKVWAPAYAKMFAHVARRRQQAPAVVHRPPTAVSPYTSASASNPAASEAVKDVTVFFVTTGDPVAEQAWAALQRQIGNPRLERIENVSPMSAAFQQMIERCKTPYFVQVDEDMILKPGAVLALREAIGACSIDVFMYAYMLWDSHLGRGIFGVKIYRLGLMQEADYHDVQSCEQDHFKQLQDMGYRYVVPGWDDATLNYQSPQVQGMHGTRYTPRTAFERYLDLTEKYRDVGGSDWYAKFPYEFLFRLLGNETLDAAGSIEQFTDLWAFLGAACGLFSDLSIPRGEKDFTKLPRGFGELRSHLVPPPVEGIIYSTARCNGKCPHCLRTLSPDSNTPDFTPALTQRMLDAYPSMRGVCVAGFGEPTLNKDLTRIIEMLRRREICVGVITNGLHITEPDGSLTPKLREASYVSVSLNATSAQEHEEMYGVGGSWARAIKGVEALAKAGVPPTLSFIVTKQTWGRVPEYLRTAQELVGGVPGARVALVNLLPHHQETDAEAHAAFLSRVLTTEDDLTRLPEYQDLARSLGLTVFAWPTPIELGKQSRPSTCQSPFVRLGVDGFANVSPCSRISPPDRKWGELDSRTWLGSSSILDLRRQLMGVRPLRWECQFCFGNWSAF